MRFNIIAVSSTRVPMYLISVPTASDSRGGDSHRNCRRFGPISSSERRGRPRSFRGKNSVYSRSLKYYFELPLQFLGIASDSSYRIRIALRHTLQRDSRFEVALLYGCVHPGTNRLATVAYAATRRIFSKQRTVPCRINLLTFAPNPVVIAKHPFADGSA